jgi:hypothetical protein
MVYDKVCEKIFARPHFLVGGVSPKPLAHDIGTSIVPVREALIRLAQQDALDNIPSKGFFIPPIKAASMGQAFNVALELLGKQKPPVYGKDKDGIEASIVENPLLSWHWHVFENSNNWPLCELPEKGQYADFDRRFLDLASTRMAKMDWDIVRYIWDRTIHYRYYIYKNFRLYATTERERPKTENYDLIGSFIGDVFDRYAKLAVTIAQLESSHQRRSPYM